MPGKGGRGKGKGSNAKAVSRSQRAGLQFPVGRVARYLKKENTLKELLLVPLSILPPFLNTFSC